MKKKESCVDKWAKRHNRDTLQSSEGGFLAKSNLRNNKDGTSERESAWDRRERER